MNIGPLTEQNDSIFSACLLSIAPILKNSVTSLAPTGYPERIDKKYMVLEPEFVLYIFEKNLSTLFDLKSLSITIMLVKTKNGNKTGRTFTLQMLIAFKHEFA
ncbi:MAG: hypothetical protein IKA36_05680 [Clostridia bacterium]|nr:hypothetical protein [Clostridia bacterium]